MSDWRASALSCMVLYGFWAYFASKSTAIYGAKVSCFMQMLGYVVLLTATGFGREDLKQITKPSLLPGIIATALAVAGTYFLFYAIHLAPKQTALITVISEGYPLITGLIMHFFVKPLLPHQWLGILLIVAGMALVNL